MGVNRREFLKLLAISGSIIALGGVSLPITKYIAPSIPRPSSSKPPRAKLVWEDGSSVKASELEINKAYVFEYPLRGVYSILINIGDENGNPVRIPPMDIPMVMQALGTTPELPSQESLAAVKAAGRVGSYKIPGGVGPNGSIVAFNSVCQHFACQYPQVKYYPPGVQPPQSFPEDANGGVIFCACHGSVYDPYRGAIVLRGPTQRPLPFVVLEWDEATDELYAVDVVGNVITGKFCNTCGELVGNIVQVKPA